MNNDSALVQPEVIGQPLHPVRVLSLAASTVVQLFVLANGDSSPSR